jgi:dTDP-4-amino-4,6-dideoxygalactose transaminase
MHIPSWPQAGEREAELIRMVLKSSEWGGFHPVVVEFEQSFAAYQHAKYSISVCNGTVALELALTVLGIGAGDEVIVPAISFIATATAVSRVGATPVFVDIENDSFNIDPERVREAITKRTKAVLAVHFGGVLCDIQTLSQICQENGLILFEDAAHAHGAEWQGRRAGSFGEMGSFSFQNGKVMSAGEGGILVTSDERLAETARSVANGGRIAGRNFFEHHRLGTNFRLTGLQAAVLLAQLERLPGQIRLRTLNASVFNNLLSDIKEIVWQKEATAQTQNPFYLLTGRVVGGTEIRDTLCQRLRTAGVPCTPFYPHTLYQNPLYARGGCRTMPCPVAETRVRDAFWLSHRVLLAEESTLQEIAGVMRAAMQEYRPAISAQPVFARS